MFADKVIKGKIFTANVDALYAEAAAMKDGKYVYVGDAEGVQEFIGPETEVLESGDGIFMPGMTDSHNHLCDAAILHHLFADLTPGHSREEYQQILREYIEANPDAEFYIGSGWDNTAFTDALPDKSLIEEVCTDKPVILHSIDQHSYIANTKAMEMVGIGKGYVTKQNGEFILDPETQEPTGFIAEWGVNDIYDNLETITTEDVKKALLEEQEILLSMGISSVYEPIVHFPEQIMNAYKELDQEGKLKMKVMSGFWANPGLTTEADMEAFAKDRDEYKGNHFRNNVIRVFADGITEAATAYLLEDYNHKPGYRGELNFDKDEYNKLARKAYELGFQVHVHSVGDAASRATIDGFEYALDGKVDKTWKPTLAHIQFIAPEDIERLAKVNGVASCDPPWMWKYQEYIDMLFIPYLGEYRALHQYPCKSMKDAGVVITGATDYPVTPPAQPTFGIARGVLRYDPDFGGEETVMWPEEKLTLEDMMLVYTINGAYQNDWEDRFGSIEVGKDADVTLLERDITTIPVTEIQSVFPSYVIIDGEYAYRK